MIEAMESGIHTLYVGLQSREKAICEIKGVSNTCRHIIMSGCGHTLTDQSESVVIVIVQAIQTQCTAYADYAYSTDPIHLVPVHCGWSNGCGYVL